MPQGAVYGVFLENDGTQYHRGVKVIKANCSCVEMECHRTNILHEIIVNFIFKAQKLVVKRHQ